MKSKRNMKLKQRNLLLLLLVSASAGWPASVRAQTPPEDTLRVPADQRQKLDDWLRSQVKKRGGNWDSQRYHFFIGFSTSQSRDARYLLAMGRLTYSLLNNSFAVGDVVTPFGWEMDVWQTGATAALTEDPATRAAVVSGLPGSPKDHTIGGHDVERALLHIMTKEVRAEEAASTIILLFTNTNESQDSVPPTGLLGANNPKLLQAYRDFHFHQPPERATFSLQTNRGPFPVDATAVFPEKIAPLPNAPTTARYPTFARETWQPAQDQPQANETLPHEAQKIVPPTRATESNLWKYILGGAAVLSVIGLIAYLLTRPKTSRADVGKPAVAETKPAGKPIAGTLEISLGAKSPQSLENLNTESRWNLFQTAEGVLRLEDADKQRKNETKQTAATYAEGKNETEKKVAALSFDAQKRLQVQTEPAAQFRDIKGSASASSNRTLIVSPGETAICRLDAGSDPAPRLELQFKNKGK